MPFSKSVNFTQGTPTDPLVLNSPEGLTHFKRDPETMVVSQYFYMPSQGVTLHNPVMTTSYRYEDVENGFDMFITDSTGTETSRYRTTIDESAKTATRTGYDIATGEIVYGPVTTSMNHNVTEDREVNLLTELDSAASLVKPAILGHRVDASGNLQLLVQDLRIIFGCLGASMFMPGLDLDLDDYGFQTTPATLQALPPYTDVDYDLVKHDGLYAWTTFPGSSASGTHTARVRFHRAADSTYGTPEFMSQASDTFTFTIA